MNSRTDNVRELIIPFGLFFFSILARDQTEGKPNPTSDVCFHLVQLRAGASSRSSSTGPTMQLALISTLAGAIAATTVLCIVVASAIYWLINLYAGEAAIPALFKLLCEGA